MRKQPLGTLCLLAATAVMLTAGASLAFVSATTKLVSGVLEGRRVASITCEVINKSGADLDVMTLTLKRPDATVLAGPFACPTVTNGETCALAYDIKFPDLDVAAYCHAEVPEGKFVRGSLRFQNSQNATLAESTLEGDLAGQLAALSEQVDGLTAPSFTFPGDGQGNGTLEYETCGDGLTVADLNTGLLWERKVVGGGTCIGAGDLHKQFSTCTWTQATGVWIDAVNGEGGTGYAGYSDWRVPNRKELGSILDLSIAPPGPAVQAEFIPTVSANYWSATPKAFGFMPAWTVDFATGDAGEVVISNPAYVRAVRTGTCATP